MSRVCSVFRTEQKIPVELTRRGPCQGCRRGLPFWKTRVFSLLSRILLATLLRIATFLVWVRILTFSKIRDIFVSCGPLFFFGDDFFVKMVSLSIGLCLAPSVRGLQSCNQLVSASTNRIRIFVRQVLPGLLSAAAERVPVLLSFVLVVHAC